MARPCGLLRNERAAGVDTGEPDGDGRGGRPGIGTQAVEPTAMEWPEAKHRCPSDDLLLRALRDSVGIATPCAQLTLSDGTPRDPKNDRSNRQ